MAYRNLYSPLSQFVDPMSTEIASELRNRYMNSRIGMSELQQSIASLATAPFEQDKKLKANLSADIYSNIDQMLERGDLENMNLRVMSLADNYNKTANVLKQNADAYSTYQASLDKAYESGDINYEHYIGNLDLSRAMYTGLQPTEYGGYGNYFRGVDIVTDPKIQERIDDALKNLKPTKTSQTTASVGSTAAGEFVGPGGMYDMSIKSETEIITPDRIDSVVDGIFRDPQVQAYLDRTAQIRMLSMDEERINSAITGYADYSQKLADDFSARSTNRKYTAADRARYAALSSQYQEEAKGYRDVLRSDAETKATVASGIIREDIENGYRNMAVANYAQEDITTEIDRNYDPVWLEGAKGGLISSAPKINVRQSGAVEIDNSLGTTYEQLSEAEETYRADNLRLQQELNNTNLSDYARAQIQSRMDSNSFFIDLATQIKEQKFADFDPAKTEEFNALNNRLQAYETALQNMMDPNRVQYGIDPIGSDRIIRAAIADLKVLIDRVNRGRGAIRDVQTKLDAVSTTTMPGLPKAENDALFNDLNAYFSKGIDADVSVYESNEGELISFGDLIAQNADYADMTFSSAEVLYNFAPIGSPAVVVRMKDKSGQTHPLFVPLRRGGVDQISLSNLNAAMNTNTFRLISSAQIASANNLKTYEAPIYIQTPTSKQPSSILFDLSDKSNIRVKFDGKWTDVTDPEFLRFIEDTHIVPLYHNNYE